VGKGETAAAGAGADGMRPREAAYGEDCGRGGRCGAGGRGEMGKRAGDGGADGLTCENRGWGVTCEAGHRAPSSELDRTAAVRSEVSPRPRSSFRTLAVFGCLHCPQWFLR
jgi:hypothetical protein